MSLIVQHSHLQVANNSFLQLLFNLLNSMTKDYQIIIATHSPFVLFQKDMDIIDIEAGYADTCINILRTSINKNDELL